MSSSYQYEPLNSPATQIRLLELLPGRGIIQCRLQVTDLQEAKGTYEPISYCWKAYSRKHWWGFTYKEKKKQRTFRIRIDGADFCITESLRAALRQMRLKTQVRLLWADAICINQAHDDEKSAQVAMMGKIYQSGKQTLAWLGDADCWTGRAFRLLKVVSSQGSEASDSSELFDESTDEPEDHSGESTDEREHHIRNAGARIHHTRRLRLIWVFCQKLFSVLSIKSIVDRPYFERAWIAQEVLLSKNVVVMCGKHEITGDELFQGVFENEGFIPRGAAMIEDSFIELWDNPELFCLGGIISKFSHTKTSDPRDKLYSALGLHENCISCGSMVIDYSKDVDEVFLDATKVLLSRSSSLDLLSMSYCTGRPHAAGERIPSWVWNPEPRSTEFHFSRAEAHDTNPFQATQQSESRPQFRGRKLGLLGYVFENVRTVGNVLSPHPGYSRKKMVEALQCYFNWVDISGMYEPGITDAEADLRIHAFRHTINPLKGKFFTANTPVYMDDDYIARQFVLFHAELVKRFSKFFSPAAKETSSRARLKLWTAIESFWWYIVWGEAVDEDCSEFVRSRDFRAAFGRRL